MEGFKHFSGFSQEADIRVHPVAPKNPFVEFKKEEIEQSIADRFEQIVLRYPDRIAVKSGRGARTYRELNMAANRIAQSFLRAQGQDNEPIALQLEPDFELVAAILGVLKAGRAYAYLDPSYPVKRISEILEDLQAGLIATNNKNLRRSEELAGSHFQHINIDELDVSFSTENPGIATSPDAHAWILYTSGSTGRPKGIVHNHRNLLHNVMTYTNVMHIATDDRLSLLHSCNVITSAKNLFGALLNGATIYPFNVKMEGLQGLVAWMVAEEITVYHSVPSLFRHFTDALTDGEQFPRLRLIVLGGEPVTQQDVDVYKKHFSEDCILVNLLGNTEMGTYRQYFVDKTSSIKSSVLPAGYGVEGKEVHVLDDTGNEVSPGDVGEIAVKSRYLAVGYWRDPAATQVSFIPDPQGGDERTHPTGDLGRMAGDGCLTYLGRKDFQVKIRGHRVDVAEVEMALLEHAAIKEAVVVAQDDPRNDKRLIAYITQSQTDGPTESELRNFLELRVPDYMVPSAFTRLDRLPLSPDGKVDRRALPAPDWTQFVLGDNFALPGDQLERVIANVWQDVLQLERVGIHDNFFDLGGHSLLLLAVREKLQKFTDQHLSATDLLKYPTISSLAQFLGRIEIAQPASQGLERAMTRRLHRGREKQLRQQYRSRAKQSESENE